ncbi:unnamed protein product [Psylliodes chrysocephalus]|uniref:Phosphatidylserine synthase n=1 Tax=Psylliodes chrysocephalus TaxID=3402493 RepID=A0A9P0CNV9_9CUCU|nr:unnamed protein product [Psylliodes chrysocephala]
MKSPQSKDTTNRLRHDSFSTINEKPVDDISLQFFYNPHTISLLLISIAALIYFAFVRDTDNLENNIWAGLLCCGFFFLIISVLAFPNGPFTRPHPAVWRMVFGMSIIYLLFCLFILFQNYQTVKSILLWLDPSLSEFHIDMDKEYGVNCSDITLDRLWGHVDVFALGHFLGWMFKAILIRHMGILWAISCMWEITELAFAHLLPNFIECWWDALILDVLLCNGFGIWCGLKICKMLEMREYKWVGIKKIHSTTGKIKRAMLQFTPESWTSVRWLDPQCSYMRIISLCQLVLFWQTSELNTFFLKHVFELPSSHFLVSGRLILIGVIVAPSVRQYYSYITDTSCKRVGTQCWVYGCIMVAEALICIKHGKALFEQTQIANMIVWVLIMIIVSVGVVITCVLYNKYYSDSIVSSGKGKKIKFQNGDGSEVKKE